jgi:asparagine synthase (glutamine-hydrolysing)
MSDVPLGVALSGGLDSSSVVASVARQTGKGPRTFSVYVGDRVNELHWARLVADRYRTEHTEIVVEPERLDEVVPRILWHLEEPMSISEIPTWYLGRAVGGNVKVLLCGEGADETFGGYKRFLPLAAAPWLPPSVLTWGYLRGINGLTRRDRRRLYAPAQRHGMVGNSNVWLDRALTEGTGPTLNRFLRYELRHQLRSQVLRLDKLTMAHGVEARCPFLDPVLVDYVANLPPQFKVRGLREKVLLKAAMRDRLPKAVVERRKFGMANPVASLFRGGFRDICRDALHDRSDILAPYFDLEAVDALFDQVGRYPVWYRIPEQQLFHIYLFLKWHEVFIEGRLPTGVEGEAMVPRRNVAGPAPLAEATSTA